MLTDAGCTDVTIDFADVSSIDQAAVWCIAATSSALTSLQLRTANRRDHLVAAHADEPYGRHTGNVSPTERRAPRHNAPPE